MTSNYQLSLPPISIEQAGMNVKKTLETAEKNLGFLPNMYKNMAHSPALLKSYLQAYQLFRNESAFSAAEQEIIFLTVSRENACEYCVAAHSAIAIDYSGVPMQTVDSIRNGEAIDDTKAAALRAFTRVMLDSKGRPPRGDVIAFLEAGFTERHVLEIIVAIAVKTMSNYANHLFQTEVDDAFAEWSWQL